MGSRHCPSPTTLVLVLLCLCHAPHWAFSLSFNLNFSDPSPSAGSSIYLAGDASISSSRLELTQSNQNDTIGRASYRYKVPLWNSATGEMASFTTNFSFLITYTEIYGSGIAFFLGYFPSAIPPNSTGRSLGLLPDYTTGTGDSQIVAVEFDTKQSERFGDINGNHVGIDVNSLNSTASTATTTTPGKNLSSLIVMEATVTYRNDSKMLAVDLLIDDALYLVNATVDLRMYLPEQISVGFSSATTATYGVMNQILSWSFSSTLPDPTTSNKHKKLVQILLSVLVPFLFTFVCASVVLVWWRQKRRRSNGDSQEQFVDRAGLERGVAAGGPRRYIYRELVAATSNFAEEKKLGRGGFGGVYQGHLTLKLTADRRAVAVKMLSAESSAQGRREFEAEVRIISRLKHRNLVQLLGWCDSRKGLLLVYQLVAEGSLDRHLYSKDRCLTWPQRYKIILGLGSALRYLHGEWEQCIVHGDIKPSNIMLDSSFNTKLGDFGLARLVDYSTGLMQTTKAVLGTVGYIDPEFINTRRPSIESDMYSFGIVLLEIVSCRPPVTETAGKSFSLLKWVWNLYGRGEILEAVDPRMRGIENDEWWMERVLVVGLWCALPDRSDRPSIAQAMHVLQSEEARLPELPPYMYMAVQPSPAGSSDRHDDSSIDDPGPGLVRYYSGTTADTIHSPELSTASVRRSRFPTV